MIIMHSDLSYISFFFNIEFKLCPSRPPEAPNVLSQHSSLLSQHSSFLSQAQLFLIRSTALCYPGHSSFLSCTAFCYPKHSSCISCAQDIKELCVRYVRDKKELCQKWQQTMLLVDRPTAAATACTKSLKNLIRQKFEAHKKNT